MLKFWIHPLFVGRGKSLFRERDKIRMKLAATKTFATGVVVLTYQRARNGSHWRTRHE
jgi:hypothetical protein